MASAPRLRDLVARNIKASRLRLGLSQSEFAGLAKVSVRYVQQLERVPGKNVTLETIEHLAKALAINSDELTDSGRSSNLSQTEFAAVEAVIAILRSLQAAQS